MKLYLLLIICCLFELKLLIVYQCSTQKFVDSKCLIVEEKEKETYYHLQNCPSEKYCQIDDNIGYCITKARYRVGGENCAVNPECYSNNCLNGTCISIKNTYKCSNHYECSYQSYCASSVCSHLKEEDELCKKDEECIAGYVCGTLIEKGQLKCLKEFSVENGYWVSHRMLCKSGFLFNKVYEPLATSSGICAESVFAGNTEECLVDSDCLYELIRNSSEIIVGKCSVSQNEVDSFCEISTSNKKWKNWLSLYSKVVDGIIVTQNQNTNYLRDNNWGNPKLKQAHNEVSNYVKFHKLDECAIRYLSSSHHLTKALVVLTSVLLLLLFLL